MREEDLEAALLLSSECRLIGPELPDQRRLVGVRRRGRRRVPEFQRDAIVPARIFGHVVRRSLDFHGEYSSAFDLLLKKRIVILQEELQELLLVSPLRLVVVLHRVRLIGRALWWRALRGGKAGQSDDGEEQQMRAHESSPFNGEYEISGGRAALASTRGGEASRRRQRDALFMACPAASFRTEGLDRIDLRRATRGDDRRHQRDDRQKQGHRHEREWVGSMHAVQLRGQETSGA